MDYNLSEKEREFLIQKLTKGENLPIDFKYKLFPNLQKEYELVYAGKMRKEDVLGDEDGVTAVPLQIKNIFEEGRETFEDGWKNMIVFGDNLQLLKTIYRNEAPLIKNKVKGKVKLIYIDPPFGTSSDFNTKTGQLAYSDKASNSDFIEFIRRRLLVAREILAPDGVIFIHLDWKKSNYIKIVLDEVFGEGNFKNSVIWHYGGRMMHHLKQYNRKYDVILFYSKKQNQYYFKMPTDEVDFDEYASARHEKIHIDKDGKRFLLAPDANMERTIKQYEEDIVSKGRAIDDVWEIRYIRGNAKERTGYPTQKPEELLKRIIESTTQEGDLVLDFFGGSGTTAAVAEKLNRKWIVCDIGKLAFYTIQKRILTIQDSKSPINKNAIYNKLAKSFITVNTGIYDLEKLFELQTDEYINFVMGLFEINPLDKTINGVDIDGERKDGYSVIIWKYWEHKDSEVDITFLETLHTSIGARLGDRLYIVAPVNYIGFIDDYYEIEGIKYYFLKVPYQVIQELHKKKFKKFRQPKSMNDINALDDVIGFHFIRQPEVESEYENGNLIIRKFISSYTEEETGDDIPNLKALAMVLIDSDYNGKNFIMSEIHFADDVLGKTQKNIKIPIKKVGNRIIVIYVDIYGNEFREELKIG